MKSAYIRLLQKKLSALGAYGGTIDGVAGPQTDAAVLAGIGALAQPVPAEFADWSAEHRLIGFLQAYAASLGVDPGPLDGFWGPQTDYAASVLGERIATGTVLPFVDAGPLSATNPNGFPDETRDQAALIAAYGPPGQKDGFTPPMVKVPLPWPMKLSWDPAHSRSFLWAHVKVADSLGRVLAKIDATYSAADKVRLGLDRFGGDYAPRIMRGANRPSMHSWGIAFDFDPDRNALHANRAQARLGRADAIPFWQAWEAEGWCSLGRVRNYDFMHVQAARRAY